MSHPTPTLTSVLEIMEDGVCIIRQDFTMDFMNKAMVNTFGPGIGLKCHQVINHTEERCPWCQAEEVFQGETLYRQIHIPTVDKVYGHIELPITNADRSVSKLSIYRDITEKIKQERELKTSAEDYRLLFERVRHGVYVSTKEGKFLNSNQALLDILCYETKEEFLKIDLNKDLYLRPEDRRKFQEMIERDGHVIDYEVDFKRKDGSPISVLLTSHVRQDPQGRVLGYEGIIQDQSLRKRMEEELRGANEFLTNIIRSSPNAIFAVDLKGNVILMNKAAEEVLGYRAEDVIGRMNIDQIYPEGLAREIMQMMRGPGYGGPGRLQSYPLAYPRHDGTTVEGNLSAAIIYDGQGREVATVGIFADLKEVLAMERALHLTQEQLLQSEKLAAMGRLTSQIAHELNNPLYGIMNTLELLKTEIPIESKRRRILDMALSETFRLTDMLRKMLSFSKPDEEEKQPTDINTILDEILLLVGKQLRENSVQLSATFAPDLGLVHASKNQLRQVFLNMIQNAREAMPDGGVLTVKTWRGAENVFIEITDMGLGIAPENIARVFDAFFTTKESVIGVGLGLSVCYGFVKEHGGDISVESALGKGTTFTITLPIWREAPPASTEPQAATRT
jgi:PAS domain S-box-containing protein